MKVVELLEECKAKVSKDLAAETTAMQDYSTFCDDELKDKAYAIETAGRSINDLSASVEDSKATISTLSDEVTTLGSAMAGKEKELYDATTVRNQAHDDFVAAEKELVNSADQLARAASTLKKGMSLAQNPRKLAARLSPVTNALSKIVEAQWVDAGSRRALKSFLQSTAAAKEDEDDDLSLAQPQAKQVAFESSSDQIVSTVEGMQGKAEDTLAGLRRREMQASHGFAMVKSGLESEIKHSQEKMATAKSGSAAATQALGQAEGDRAVASKTKAGDEAYAATLKGECEQKAEEWSERQASAKEEMAVIDKAKEILVSGVKAFVQMTESSKKAAKSADDDEDDKTAERRQKIVNLLKDLASTHHSFALNQMASMATSDPFVKIRSLIEDMVSKLVKEANEDATHEAFCNEEIGKSTNSVADKQAKVDQYQVRMDGASATIGTQNDGIKTLDAEIAESDRAVAEATQLRATAHNDYVKASTDFRDSANAVARAVEVLKNYYQGALLQVSATTQEGPDFGSAKGDSAHTIIAVLEMAEEDFTRLLAEEEAAEDEAATAFKKLTEESRVSKAAKQAEAKAKASEVKSLTVQLSHSKEDHASVSKELDAVHSYLSKLRPECESKAMSYEERKAARDAEIAGLKDALNILEGNGLALVQSRTHLRTARRV